jgi:hypothetical protein
MNLLNKQNSNLFYRIVFSVLAIVGLNALSSCKKYLDLQPVSGQVPDIAFSTVATTQDVVMGVYQELEGDQGYGIRLSLYYTVDNDETMGPTGDDNDRRGLAHYHLLASNAQLEAPYDQLYAGIERANQCIYYIPKSPKYSDGNPGDSIQMHKMLGEALTLRSLFYLELIRNWGDVPAQFLPSAFEPTAFLPRTDRDSIYDHILNDLLVAEQYVPWKGDPNVTTDGRLTQGAVRGIRARIALYRGGYSLRQNPVQMIRRSDYLKYDSIAMNECDTVMMKGIHSLNPSYKSVFKNYICGGQIDNQYGEVMFEVGFGAAGLTTQGTNSSKLGYYDGPKLIVNSSTSAGNASILVLPTYFYAFSPGDLRRDVTIAPYDVNADGSKTAQKLTALRDGKFRRDWTPLGIGAASSGLQYFNISWPVLRYSDVLLMYAEADNEITNGTDQSAYDAINQVRRRGFGYQLTAPSPVDIQNGIGHDSLLSVIVNERSLELGAEGFRKYDLIRWNLLGTKLAQARAALTAWGSGGAPANYPTSMYYYVADGPINSASAAIDDSTLFAFAQGSSFYSKVPSPAPSGSVAKSVTWIGSGIASTFITPSGAFLGLAGYFTPNHCELYPLPQHTVDAGGLPQYYGY